MPDWYQKCSWSQSGSACHSKHCPLKNKRFSGALDRWALLGRAPKGKSMFPSIGGGADPEWQMLKKARIARLFKDDQLILDFITNNKPTMSKELCAELVRGEQAFRSMVWKEKYGQ